MRDLRGRTALVTGASRGIGAAIARALAAEGMRLALAARSAADLEALAAELRAGGHEAVSLPTDVADASAVAALAEAAEARFGGVDLLVNNAGVITATAYHEMDPWRIEHVLRVDLVAPMRLSRLVLPGMLARGRGHIVNLASMAGRFGFPGLESYCAAKAGLANFTAALRAAYRSRGVSASAVLPGFVHGSGMYQRFQDRTGLPTPRLMGSSSVQRVVDAVLRAVRSDLADVVVNPGAVRPFLALQALWPRLAERLLAVAGGDWYQRAGRLADDRETPGEGQGHGRGPNGPLKGAFRTWPPGPPDR